jgi:hypothetical protein
MFVRPNLISWSARKQATIFGSNTEAKYKVLANSTTELIWVESILGELCVILKEKHYLWCDNLTSFVCKFSLPCQDKIN